MAFRWECAADTGGDLTWQDGIGCSLDVRVSVCLYLCLPACVCVCEREREREREVALIVLFVGFGVCGRSLELVVWVCHRLHVGNW
jgi:hypothetical protein